MSLTPLQPDKQISQIEKSVTHLLVATKQLLETLTQWSRNQAQEEEVSDVYVRLGYEFNLACRAFNSIGVDTSDLGNVPDLLRHILEDTLSQPASPQALDTYLPRIRDIIINLLHGLKRKQSKLRGRGPKDATSTTPTSGRLAPGRQGSLASTTGSSETGLTQMLDDVPPTTSSRNENRYEAVKSPEADGFSASSTATPGSINRGSINRRSVRQDAAPIVPSDSTSSMSSNTAQSLPVQMPYVNETPRPPSEVNFPHPPPPPPKQDALAALQRGGDLERRASRRFSAYQISKHLGASPNGIPVIPPAQNSPIPNRGHEVRESMSAVRARGSYRRSRTSQHQDISPSRSGTIRAPQRISEEREEPVLDVQNVPKISPPTDPAQDDSPIAKTPEEYRQPPPPQTKKSDPVISATLNGPVTDYPVYNPDAPTPDEAKPPEPPQHQESVKTDSSPATVERKPRSTTIPPVSQIVDLESSPPQGKELTLFLQYKSKIKKFVLAEGYDELTLARLQLAFIEKFAWNTHNTGVDLPEIYVQDQVSGVRHELEDLSDVKDRSVLVLNVEALDEVKRHFDDGMGNLQKTLDSFKFLLEGQGSMMQRFSDRQLETSKEMARMSALPAPRPTRNPSAPTNARSGTPSTANMQEVQNLRRDIAVLRQTYSAMASDFSGAMNDIKSKAANIKTIAAEAAVPSYSGDSGRSHILTGKKQLSTDSEALLSRVDDLADIVDELRKDVVTRGVRPLPRQLEDVGKELSMTLKELSRIKEFVKREKPVWTKIWEGELQVVMSEREDLTQREEIIGDLDGDLEDLAGTFKLVEEVTKQQNLTGDGTKGRNASGRMIEIDAAMDPMEAKTGMLDEVRALSVNHENRLEAIERAEKARKRELMSRKGGEFQREVEQFVSDGRLRKTGGAEEVERVRRVRVEKARREHEEWLREREREKYEAMKREYEGEEGGAAQEGGMGMGADGAGSASGGYGFMAGQSGFDFDDDGDEDEDDFEIMPDGSVRTKPKAKAEDGGGNTNGVEGAPQLPEIDLRSGKTSPETSRDGESTREADGNGGNSDGTSFYVGD
jgi:hypothetical protein